MREDRTEVEEFLLVGNPNAGKSTIFNLLTGKHAKVGNWHGVTVGALEGYSNFGRARVKICDLPGIYSTNGLSLEEKGALDYLRAHEEASILFVSECASLEKSLPLFRAIGRGRKCMLLLTKKRRFLKAGGKIDERALQRELSLPVISVEGLSEKALKSALSMQTPRPFPEIHSLQSFRPQSEALSRAERFFLKGYFCVPLVFLIMLVCFYLTFAPRLLGETMKEGIEWFFSDYLGGFAERIPAPALRGFVKDGLLSGVGSVLCFLPQISLLFFTLILLEESGLLSRLAFFSDGFLSKVGLSGRAVFSLLMGFGCSAAAILTTRGLDDRKLQRRVILSLPYLACSAKLPVFLTIASSFFENPFFAVALLYALGVGLALLVALFFKRESPPFVMELAPLQLPRPQFVVKSLCFQIKQFIIKLATVILAFFLVSWALSSFRFDFSYCGAEESMLAKICGGLKFLFAPVGMNDWKIAYAALSGLIAKENVAGALAMFYGGFPYSAHSAFAFSIFLLTCSPCVSAIASAARELGWREALKNALVQTVSALFLSYLVYFLLEHETFSLLLLPAAAIFLVGWKRLEKIRSKRKRHLKKFHR